MSFFVNLFLIVVLVSFIAFALYCSMHDKASVLDRIGSSSWFTLHTFAESFPINPSSNDQEMAAQFLESFCYFYPCKQCRDHMRLYMHDHPILFETRSEVVRWIFQFHNDVNLRLHKPVWSIADYVNRGRYSIPPETCNGCQLQTGQ